MKNGRCSRMPSMKSWICRRWPSKLIAIGLAAPEPLALDSRAARISPSSGLGSRNSQRAMSSSSMTAEPCSPQISMRRENPGHSAVLASMVPKAPLTNFSAATAVSSDSIAVHALRGPREHLDRHAGKPLQQIDAMDRLVDDRAAAILGKLALPARVVVLRAVPFHVAAREHHAAETARVDRGLQLPRAIAETCLEDGADAHASLAGLLQDVVRAFDRRVERLLDHQVFTGADGRERRLEMQRRGRRDAHRVQAGLLKQLADARRSRSSCRVRCANACARG